jgi:hypothetical protein
MMKLIQAIIELLEAKAENIREDTATLQLGTYARGYKDGQDDSADFEFVLVDETEDEDD